MLKQRRDAVSTCTPLFRQAEASNDVATVNAADCYAALLRAGIDACLPITMGAGFLAADFASWPSYTPHDVRFLHVELGVLVIDVLLLAMLMAVALKADRGWTLVGAALQITAVGAHLEGAGARDAAGRTRPADHDLVMALAAAAPDRHASTRPPHRDARLGPLLEPAAHAAWEDDMRNSFQTASNGRNADVALRSARAASRSRLVRARSFAHRPGLFSDPAWDMLVDLFVAQAEGRRVGTSSVCLASGVPMTTALRHLGLLAKVGLVVRTDPADRRRSFCQLTPTGVEGMTSFFVDASV